MRTYVRTRNYAVQQVNERYKYTISLNVTENEKSFYQINAKASVREVIFNHNDVVSDFIWAYGSPERTVVA